MTRIFWDTILLISGSLFTFGAGQSSSAIIEANISIDRNPTAAPNTSSNSSVTPSNRSTSTTPATITATTNITTAKSLLFIFGEKPMNATISDAAVSINTTSTAAPNSSTSSSNTTNNSTTTTNTVRPVKKFVAAAVRSHFDDCPDSHRHFCFHGTCRFLIMEETPACVCHPGFVGMRCEHADLLAVVATNHRQQTVATMLVLCVIGCVLIMVLCTFLHCWWRQDRRRRSHAHHCVTEKQRAPCCPSESVV